jgi:hypothetical protein
MEAASRGGAWVRVPPNVVKALGGGDSQIDKDVGDTVTVTVARDESKRAVTVPADLAAVLLGDAAQDVRRAELQPPA